MADPLADTDPWLDTAIDWEKTVHFRHYLWDLGLGVAEAMDTAQRGGGLDWPGARELIRHTLEAAKGRPGVKVCCGVGTDHLEPAAGVRIDDIIRAYEEQIETIEAMGGQLVVMASRALAARCQKRRTTMCRSMAAFCGRCESRSSFIGSAKCSIPRSPAIGARPITRAAMENCLGIICDNATKIDGVKISLLSKEKEIEMRRKLPARRANVYRRRFQLR